MKITLKPEYSGKDNYISPWSCPIAQALQALGYTGVSVALDWDGSKEGKRFHGELTRRDRDIAMDWAKHKKDKELVISIFDPIELATD